MNRINLNKELENSLKGDDLINLGIDISEMAIDHIFDEGILKDIPILNSIITVFKAGKSIRDALFVKKVILFLLTIQEVPNEKRKTFLVEMSKVQTEKNRLIEKLLLTIDKLDDSDKSLFLEKYLNIKLLEI